jgi:hypothetical protein
VQDRKRSFGLIGTNGHDDVAGYVVLLDAGLTEITPRQECLFDYRYVTGGAVFNVTTSHTFTGADPAAFAAIGTTDGLQAIIALEAPATLILHFGGSKI